MKMSVRSLFSSKQRSTGARLVATLALVLAIDAVGDPVSDATPWHVHGFLSQAAFHTSDNNFAGESDDGISTDFTEAGLNGSLALLPNVRVSGQVLSRNAGRYDNGEWRTDYFNFDWQFWSNADVRIGTRVGRVRNTYGLFNDTRDVAHTRPGIILPTVVYIEQARDLYISRDGVGLYSDIFSTQGTFTIEGGVGKARASHRLATEALMADADGIKLDDARVDLLALSWEDAGGRWRFAGTFYRITSGLNASLDDILPGTTLQFEGDFELNNWLLSAQYSAEQWQVTAEFLRFNYDLDFDLASRHWPGEGIYAQYAWLFSSAWQIFGRYEYGVIDRQHRNGSSMEQFCDTPLDAYCSPRHAGYRRATVVGMRWDINAQWMIATEAHYVEGTMGLPYSDNRNRLDTAPYWTLFGLEVAFRF